MTKTRKSLLAILSFLFLTCISLSIIFFVSPKTTAVAESPSVLLTFDDTADADNFGMISGGGGNWTVSNGVLNDGTWGHAYYKTALPSTSVRIITFDFYIASGVFPTFGFMNASQISTANQNTTMSGIYWYPSAYNNAVWSSVSHGVGGSSGSLQITTKNYNFPQYCDALHTMTVILFNKTISFAIDGTTIVTTSNISDAITEAGLTLEDSLYFVVGTNSNKLASYIDNFEIKDYFEAGTNVSIDFEDSADANSFAVIKSGGTKWTVSDGVLNDQRYGAMYYTTPIKTTGTRIISFDMHYSSGGVPAFGLWNVSKSPASTAYNSQKVGMFWVIKDNGTNSWLSHSLTGNWIASKEYNFAQYYNSVHRMEIRIINKSVTFAIDGTVALTATNISDAFNSVGYGLEDYVYFCFTKQSSSNSGTYIDNFEIKDSLPGIPEKDFTLLDKLALSGGNGGGNFYFDQDIKDYASGSLARMNIYTTQAGNTGKGYDLTGADYLAFHIDNQADINASFYTMFFEGNGSGYGRRWVSAENTPYYLEHSNGKVEGGFATTESNNFGIATIPSGFVGKLIVPITSYEVVSWSVNSNAVLKYSDDANVINLSQIKWIDFCYIHTETATTGSLVISNPQIYGNYIPAVDNSSNRVINLINNIGNVTRASESQIALAREQYDALSDKSKVFNYSVLEKAESDFAKLSENNNVITSEGKDFTGSGGVAFGEIWTQTPSTISAWIKVERGISDNTHIGTIVGNMGRTGSNFIYDTSNSFSLEVTTNGNLKLEWRKSRTAKAVLVAENVDVRTGTYTHVAFTRDLTRGKLALYVDGVKVAEQDYEVSSLANLTFINPVMIGSDYTDDMIHALGYTPDFNGYIACVRAYAGLLTDNEIANDALGAVQEGLMANVDFISGEEGEYYDSVGLNATDAFGWKDYSSLDDLKLGDYTFAIFPDTQMLFSKAVDSNGNNLYTNGYNLEDNILYKNTSWLATNKDAINLKFVMHVGDLTDTLNYSEWATKGAAEMYYAMESMNVLTGAGIPWSISRGNHDSGSTPDRLAFWDNGFNVTYEGVNYVSTGYNGAEYGVGSTRISNLKSNGTIIEFGSMEENNMRNTYYTFQVNNVKWLVVALDLEPSDDVITWANEVISEHSDHQAIITTHAYLTSSGSFMTSPMFGTNYGEAIWTKLASKHSNVVMVLCGHSSGENVIKKELVGENGNKVWNFMIDYSQHEFAGNRQTGVFALFGIDDDGKTLHVNYLSVVEEKLFRSINQFSVSLGAVTQEETEKLVIYDVNGKVAVELEKEFKGILPTLERSGHIFLGYLVDGTLYNSYDYKGSEISVQAVFAKLNMINGASTRIGDYGIKFATYLDMTAEEIVALGLTAKYGTLIAPNSEILVNGVQDYSKLTIDYTGRIIDLKSTVQVQYNGYTIINASVVQLTEQQLELEIVARGYMTVTYADGTEVTFYAGVNDNARSIKEVAAKAISYVSKIQTEVYKYEVDGGYSRYDKDERDYLELVAG